MAAPNKLEREARLAKRRELRREFPDSSIPQMLNDQEDDLLQPLRDLNK